MRGTGHLGGMEHVKVRRDVKRDQPGFGRSSSRTCLCNEKCTIWGGSESEAGSTMDIVGDF